MGAEKRYTLAQLRGAFAAGSRGQSLTASEMEIRTARLKRAMDWTEEELWRLVELHGVNDAFCETEKRGNEWVQCLIVNLFNTGGGEIETVEIFKRILERISRLDLSSNRESQIALAELGLERCLWVAMANMDNMAYVGAR